MLLAKEIAERLSREAERFCRELLPHGKMEAGNWCVGSSAGEKGDSLRIQISGSKAGVWCDFASGAATERGDLLDLMASVRNVTLGEAIKEAKQWLRISDPVSVNPPRKYIKPKVTGIIAVRRTPDTDVEKYLMQERKLARDTITAFKIGQFDHQEIGRCIAFPSDNADGELAAVKYVALERKDGKKQIKAVADQAPALFGWQAFPKKHRTALICEGQIDAMTWHQWGVPALSVPNGCAGGGHDNWIDYEWDNLSTFDTIFISFDMDKEGIASTAIIARRLGIHRCLLVKLPHNDANECLQKGCDGGEAAKWLMEAKPMAPVEIKTPKDFRDKIMEMENPDPNKKQPGLEFPVLGKRIRFVPGETTIWTGYSFHGKSTLLNQLALTAALEGQKVAIGSFEMPGEQTCSKLARCLAFRADIVPILDECLDWMSDKIWIYDVLDLITEEKLFELMLYSVMRHGVKHIVIDSLMKCNISSEDYEAQRKFLNRLITFCHQHEICGHIVAHPKKADDDTKAPEVMDIHGGQSVSGQPSKIIVVWRNNKKGDKREDGTLKPEQEKDPDAYVFIRKDRIGGNRFKMGLWYHRGCHRFTSSTAGSEPYYDNYNIIKPPIDPAI